MSVDRLRLVHYETTPDAPPPAGAAAVEAPPSGPAAAAAAAEPVPAGMEAPAPAPAVEVPEGLSEEQMQEALREYVTEVFYDLYGGANAPQPPTPGFDGQEPYYGPNGYPPQPGYPQPDQGFDWSQVDPYAEDFGQRLGVGIEATLQRIIGQQIAPISGSIAAREALEREERGNALVEDMISAELAAGPDLTEEGKAMLQPLAESMMPALLAQGHPQHPRTSELAIKKAAQQLRAMEAAAASRGVVTHQNQVATLQTAPPAEPPPAGAAAVVPAPAPGAPCSPAELARAWGGRA